MNKQVSHVGIAALVLLVRGEELRAVLVLDVRHDQHAMLILVDLHLAALHHQCGVMPLVFEGVAIAGICGLQIVVEAGGRLPIAAEGAVQRVVGVVTC